MIKANVLALADVIERGFPDLHLDMHTMYDGRSGCLVGFFHRWTWGENAPRISPDDERQQNAAIAALADFLDLPKERVPLLIRERDAAPQDAARTLRDMADSGWPVWSARRALPMPDLRPVPLLTN